MTPEFHEWFDKHWAGNDPDDVNHVPSTRDWDSYCHYTSCRASCWNGWQAALFHLFNKEIAE